MPEILKIEIIRRSLMGTLGQQGLVVARADTHPQMHTHTHSHLHSVTPAHALTHSLTSRTSTLDGIPTSPKQCQTAVLPSEFNGIQEPTASVPRCEASFEALKSTVRWRMPGISSCRRPLVGWACGRFPTSSAALQALGSTVLSPCCRNFRSRSPTQVVGLS